MQDETIDMVIDKEPYIKKLTDDNIINLTGEGGSGKTTYASKYFTEDDIIIDYDEFLMPSDRMKPIEQELRTMILEKYGKKILRPNNIEEMKKNFTIIYQEILDYFANVDKRIILDGTQLRFIEDVSLIKGTVVVLRPSLKTCLERSVTRFKLRNPYAREEDAKDYYEKRLAIYKKLTPVLNELINNIDQLEIDKGMEL